MHGSRLTAVWQSKCRHSRVLCVGTSLNSSPLRPLKGMQDVQLQKDRRYFVRRVSGAWVDEQRFEQLPKTNIDHVHVPSGSDERHTDNQVAEKYGFTL